MSLNSTSNYVLDYVCFKVVFVVFTTISMLRLILLLPLSIFILYLGHQQWQQQRSFKAASHSDIFTYHVTAMELIWVFGYICSIGGTYANQPVIMITGAVVSSISYYGEMLFHILTCVERYLAVVHPIIYLKLKNTSGVRIRNISIGCVWLLTLKLIFMCQLFPNYQEVQLFCLLAFSILIISYCSFSVFCVLIRPGPGDGGKGKKRVDQSLHKAFQTITAITCAVWLWVVGHLFINALSNSTVMSSTVRCVLKINAGWFNLPSCLVLPLLYLHRAGKLSCC